LEVGISIGVLLSIALVLFRQMKPKTSALSLYSDGSYRDADRRGLKRCEHILLLRFNGALFFANAIYLEDRLLEEVARMPKLKHIIIVGNGINEIDVGGEEVLSQLFKKLRYDGYGVHVSGANDAVRDVIRRSELSEAIKEENLFPNARTAIRVIRERAKRDPETEPLCDPNECPLSEVVMDPDNLKTSGIREAIEDDAKERAATK
jgi:MFS superfamily sulfate permease-like transporter